MKATASTNLRRGSAAWTGLLRGRKGSRKCTCMGSGEPPVLRSWLELIFVEKVTQEAFFPLRQKATPRAVPKTRKTPMMPATMVANAPFLMPGKT